MLFSFTTTVARDAVNTGFLYSKLYSHDFLGDTSTIYLSAGAISKLSIKDSFSYAHRSHHTNFICIQGMLTLKALTLAELVI